jgi:hypothetical protein
MPSDGDEFGAPDHLPWNGRPIMPREPLGQKRQTAAARRCVARSTFSVFVPPEAGAGRADCKGAGLMDIGLTIAPNGSSDFGSAMSNGAAAPGFAASCVLA